MTAFTPVYTLAVYEPRSVNPVETTVLAPIAGAVHSDDFFVSSSQDVDNHQPYLDTTRGRRGRIDPLERTTDAGELIVRILDKRTGSGNLERWVTAFLGDESLKGRLIGRKVVISEDLGTGDGPQPFYTGRIQDVRLATPLWIELVLRDMAEDLNRDVFVCRPHRSLLYAHTAPITPLGPAQAYGEFDVVDGIGGTIESSSYLSGCGEIRVDDPHGRAALAWVATAAVNKLATTPLASAADARVLLTVTSTGVTGEFRLYPIRGVVTRNSGYDALHPIELRSHRIEFKDLGKTVEGRYWFPAAVGVQALEATEPGYMALPADGTDVTFRIVRDAPASSVAPIVIDHVHPVQLWRDLLEGKFSRRDADDDLFPILPYDADAFAALIADTSFPTFRAIIDKPSTANKWIEEHLCKPYGLAYQLDAEGQVVPIDMRLPSSVPAVETIGQADLETGTAPRWSHDRGSAVTRIEVVHYRDRLLSDLELFEGGEYPTVVGTRIATEELLYARPLLGSVPDLGEQTFKVDAIGLRASATDTIFAEYRRDWADRQAQRLGVEAAAPFVAGGMFATLTCRRTANTSGCWPGDWRIVDVDALPDPATNVRGGTRLMRCIERTENGILLELAFLDAGLAVAIDPPTLGSPSLDTSGATPTLQVAVTLNADGYPAVVEYAATATSVAVRPAETATEWTFGAYLTASGTAEVAGMPDNKRIWVRARTV